VNKLKISKYDQKIFKFMLQAGKDEVYCKTVNYPFQASALLQHRIGNNLSKVLAGMSRCDMYDHQDTNGI
jgi:hypothetical protein